MRFRTDIQNLATVNLHLARSTEVAFVVDDEVGDFILSELLHQLPFGNADFIIGNHKDGQVNDFQHFQRFLDALRPDGAFIVNAGGVDDDARSDTKDFDGFAHGVGGGAGRGIHNGDLLSRDGVDQRALAVVPSPKNADVRLVVTSFHGGKSTNFSDYIPKNQSLTINR